MSLKVIKIDSPIGDFITADSTLITADSTMYTADQTSTAPANTYVLNIIPRFYANLVKVKLLNEDTSELTELECEAVEDNGKLLIEFTMELSDGQSLETTVTNMDDTLMWRGKIYATTQEDLENFTLYPKTNNKIVV